MRHAPDANSKSSKVFFKLSRYETRGLGLITRQTEQLSYCADVCRGVFLDQSIFRHILDNFLPQKWNLHFRRSMPIAYGYLT